MDKSVNIVLGNSLGDALSAVDVDILEREVPVQCQLPSSRPVCCRNSLGRVVPANQVENDVRVPHTLLNRLGVV